jgi:hypothetical protein
LEKLLEGTVHRHPLALALTTITAAWGFGALAERPRRSESGGLTVRVPKQLAGLGLPGFYPAVAPPRLVGGRASLGPDASEAGTLEALCGKAVHRPCHSSSAQDRTGNLSGRLRSSNELAMSLCSAPKT